MDKRRDSVKNWAGWHTILGADEFGNETPYMTRIWIGRLRLHIFHRPDQDPDPHDHPWDFWTFPLWPLHGYVEEVVRNLSDAALSVRDDRQEPIYHKRLVIVPALRLSFRPAEHCHRVLGAWTGTVTGPHKCTVRRIDYKSANRAASYITADVDASRTIVTLVWRTGIKRKCGFLKSRDGRWCWVAWRDYVFGGGKSAPCE
jgi:hypothetical protein